MPITLICVICVLFLFKPQNPLRSYSPKTLDAELYDSQLATGNWQLPTLLLATGNWQLPTLLPHNLRRARNFNRKQSLTAKPERASMHFMRAKENYSMLFYLIFEIRRVCSP